MLDLARQLLVQEEVLLRINDVLLVLLPPVFEVPLYLRD